MKTFVWSFAGAGVKTIGDGAAPSGGYYVVNGAYVANGELVIESYPSSGIYITISGSPSVIDNLMIYPTGTIPYAETLQMRANGACKASVSYILVLPDGMGKDYSYTHEVLEYADRTVTMPWAVGVLSGSYAVGYGG